jgi:RNA recognition motif-containing protein
MNIYVGNISYNSTDDSIKALFEPFGEVESVRIITDKFTGRSRGFAFVQMANEEDGKKAIEELNGSDIDGRKVIVNEARPKQDSPRTGGERGGDRGSRGSYGSSFSNRY